MFDRFDTWLLIGLFLWLGACIIINAASRKSRKVRKLEHRCKVLSRVAKSASVERDTVLSRDTAWRSFVSVLKDAEIDRLNAIIAEKNAKLQEKDDEIALLERKYDALVDLRAEIYEKGGAKA